MKLYDNKGLSTYKVQIFTGPDFPYPDEVVDSTVALKNFTRVWSVNRNDTDSFAAVFYIQNTQAFVDSVGKSKQYPVRAGEYTLRFACLDLSGNFDSLDTKVVLAYPRIIE